VKQLNVLLLGDDCRDIYVYGHVNRISPEAPVPILEESHSEVKLGMSGNVFENLAKLNCNVKHITGNKTSVKTRYIDLKSGHQLMRLDEDCISDPIELSEQLFEQNFDCVVVSDYNKGSITNDTFDRLTTIYRGPIFVDTKKTDLSHLDIIYPPSQIYIKINELEYSKLQYKNTRNLIVTMGKDGAKFKGKKYNTPKVNVADVCGAGDTHLSALAYMFCQTGDIEHSIRWANRAASITVQHLGVYAPTLEEINAT
jgi:D-beta-D-heptose 7-phosphate kinase/D-beta-D-heptose 1-phosphate adenosyltransferase